MSLKEYAICDGKCGKESKDFYADGWLILHGKLIKFNGRDKEGQVKTSLVRTNAGNKGGLHFCSTTCLLALEDSKANFKVTLQECSNVQASFGNCSDPRKFLSKSRKYEVDAVEVHSNHKRYLIENRWYNSVCFKKIEIKEKEKE